MDDTRNNSGSSLFRLLFLDIVPKLSLSFVALSYVFGFIIVNTHLGNFGILSIAILKAKYIAAGGLFLVFVLLVGMTIYPLLLFLSRQQPSLSWEEALYSAGSLVLMMFLLQHIAPETVFHNPDLSSIYSKIAIGLLILFIILFMISSSPLSNRISELRQLRALFFFVSMGVVAYRAIDPHIFLIFLSLGVLGIWAINFTSGVLKVTAKKMKVSDLALSTVWVVCSLLALCKSYSDNLYPKIVNQYGGGKPVSVTLFLGQEKNPELQLLFKDSETSSQAVQDVTLLDEDSDYFFIQKEVGQKTETIRIRKPLVSGIMHVKK